MRVQDVHMRVQDGSDIVFNVFGLPASLAFKRVFGNCVLPWAVVLKSPSILVGGCLGTVLQGSIWVSRVWRSEFRGLGLMGIEGARVLRTESKVHVTVSVGITWTPKVCKIMAQNHSKQPKRPLFYILLGSRYK